MAALLADLGVKQDGDSLSPESDEIQSLRGTLYELAQASEQVEQQFSDELAAIHLSTEHTSTTDSTPEFYAGDTTSESNSSGSSQHSFDSPLGFLQAALPHIPTSRLNEALINAGDDSDDVDIEAVIDALLTSEYVRELEERGIGGLDAADHNVLGIPISETISWETMTPKSSKERRPPQLTPKTPKRKTQRGKTTALVDIRQKQHIRSQSSGTLAAPDPWTQMSSLASHVASFLPPHETSFFLSYFHDSKYGSPSKALRAALTSISESTPSTGSPSECTAILFGLLDVVCASSVYESLTSEEKSLLTYDAQLCLAAASGRGEDALDLVWLLHELDRDEDSGNLELGMYHAPSTPTATKSSPWPTSPTSVPIPLSPLTPSNSLSSQPASQISASAASQSNVHRKPNPFQWQSIPIRKPPQIYPHAAFIPSSKSSTSGTRRPQVGGNALGKGGKGDIGELGRWKMRESIRKRDELLRQAAGAWKSGSKKSRGGEVAAYFAERAREFQEMARMEQLENARAMVEAKRYEFMTINC